MNRTTAMLCLSMASGTVLVAAGPQWSGPAPLPRIVLNDNHEPAGTMRDGVLILDLEIVEADWYLLGDDQTPGRVPAFAERGEKPSIPGPLLRVPVGAPVHVTVTNPLETTLVIHGLGDRFHGTVDQWDVPSGETREMQFTADVVGTYFYWAAPEGVSMSARAFEYSQLSGAFVIEDSNQSADDRILIIGSWTDNRLPDGEPDAGREFLVINGRPWPHTERLMYAMGDSVRWRVINAAHSIHSMHLHGFYYRIDARGDLTRDTLYWPSEQRMAVTERIAPGTTMRMSWSPDRPGGWIFHCHMSEHVIPNPTMDERLTEEERLRPLLEEDQAGHNSGNHAVEGMGGLVMGIYIQPPEGWVPNEPKRREMRLFIQTDTVSGGLSGRKFGYVLQEGDREPARDSVRVPGSPLFLQKGEPTAILVINRTDEPSQVHWHGLEIESYFDGVAGASGYPGRLTPVIAPGDSFEIRITPPRAGTFMYHTHVNDLRQQGSGLYGAFIVLEEDGTWDQDKDRLFIFGESPFRSDRIPILNGANPEPISLRVGTTYRLRFMDIVLNRPNTVLRLLRDGFPAVWTPVAKDGFDLPPTQVLPRLAEQRLAVGETRDFEFTPTRAGEMHLELRQGNGVLLIDQVVNVVP